MANALATQRFSPANNPDSIFVKDTITGNYVTGGDTVNLTPSTWSDPGGIGTIGPDFPVNLPPEVEVANAGGYKAEWVPGNALNNGKLKWYAPGGAEVAAGAYPAAITGATVILRILLNS